MAPYGLLPVYTYAVSVTLVTPYLAQKSLSGALSGEVKRQIAS